MRLSSVTAINVVQSARSRRETHVADWLPEPVDTNADPGLGAERREAVELGYCCCWKGCRPRNELRTSFETEHRRLLDFFIAAAQRGDVAGLEGVLASDVVSISARVAAA